MFGCTGYAYWRADGHASKRAGVSRCTDRHEREQANVEDVRTCMHACRGHPRHTGRRARAMTGAGARTVTGWRDCVDGHVRVSMSRRRISDGRHCSPESMG
ncbi:hypothetical protein CRG98_028507 [Punica granatum]|uniref:Uncharacterized protein n=1 Tax=Punica granatum TaxID=22663 RepID=A0A2I0J4D1_PUNGR|nr:hypothetical protein CRG98_028507 [Punica granatum]